jgi:large subunit ribosomal protein L28
MSIAIFSVAASVVGLRKMPSFLYFFTILQYFDAENLNLFQSNTCFTEKSPIFAVLFRKLIKNIIMAKVCDITGKRVRVGNNVSHANNKTKRTFSPNLQKKKFYIPEDGVWIELKVSTRALKTIDKYGISEVFRKMAKGKKF